MFKRLPEITGGIVNIVVNGQRVEAREGESVAAAVLANGLFHTRTTPVSGAPRAPFCLMGACYECLMVIDGRPNRRACMETVREGMRIECQRGAGETPS